MSVLTAVYISLLLPQYVPVARQFLRLLRRLVREYVKKKSTKKFFGGGGSVYLDGPVLSYIDNSQINEDTILQ